MSEVEAPASGVDITIPTLGSKATAIIVTAGITTMAYICYLAWRNAQRPERIAAPFNAPQTWRISDGTNVPQTWGTSNGTNVPPTPADGTWFTPEHSDKAESPTVAQHDTPEAL